MNRRALRHLEEELADLAGRGLLRASEPAGGAGDRLVLCSNDYLGYGSEPLPGGLEAAPGGAGASRLVCGDREQHTRAEAALACWLGTEAALLFSSGYAANVGAVAALAGPGDLIVSDRLNHASIIDGCRLSGARVVVVPHLDAGAVEAALSSGGSFARRWVVTESYFSMDGDIPDLKRLRSACDAHDAALVVDEAHALGVLGPRGSGLCAEAGVEPDVLIGTLGKALGLQGAFVAGSHSLRSWLWNRARSFVFSTGISPLIAAAAVQRTGRAAADDAGRVRLRALEAQLREGLAGIGGFELVSQRGPVLPWVVGPAREAMRISAELLARGVWVQPIRPPTVPEGSSRLRITVTANLDAAGIDRALAAFRQVGR